MMGFPVVPTFVRTSMASETETIPDAGGAGTSAGIRAAVDATVPILLVSALGRPCALEGLALPVAVARPA